MNEMPYKILNYTWVICVAAIIITMISSVLAKEWKEIIRKWKDK